MSFDLSSSFRKLPGFVILYVYQLPLIANVLEHGRSNQPARPFLAPTRSQTKRAAIAAMKQTLAARIQQVKP